MEALEPHEGARLEYAAELKQLGVPPSQGRVVQDAHAAEHAAEHLCERSEGGAQSAAISGVVRGWSERWSEDGQSVWSERVVRARGQSGAREAPQHRGA